VLGCTHYPLLAPLIAEEAEQLAGRPIAVVDSAAATADAVREWIEQDRISGAPGASSSLELLVTDRPHAFASVASRFLGEEVPPVELVDLTPG